MTDKVILTGIECYAYGGVTEAERQIGQRYRIDVEMGTDIRAAAATDSINEAIHYGHVHDAAVTALLEAPFRLIEAAAEHIAMHITAQFEVEYVTIRLSKLLPPIDGVVAAASVEITRTRE
ncbi:MAG TPA: dihydroneopterin aldolase [Chloroflexota bacterium]